MNVALVAWTTALSRLGWVMITPGWGACPEVLDIACMTIHSQTVHVAPMLPG